MPSGIAGIKHLPRLKEISLGWDGKVARLGVLQGELNAHPNHPVLRLQCDRSDVTECSTTAVQVEEAMGEGEESSLHPDPAAAGETSSQVVAVTTGSDRLANFSFVQLISH